MHVLATVVGIGVESTGEYYLQPINLIEGGPDHDTFRCTECGYASTHVKSINYGSLTLHYTEQVHEFTCRAKHKFIFLRSNYSNCDETDLVKVTQLRTRQCCILL